MTPSPNGSSHSSPVPTRAPLIENWSPSTPRSFSTTRFRSGHQDRHTAGSCSAAATSCRLATTKVSSIRSTFGTPRSCQHSLAARLQMLNTLLRFRKVVENRDGSGRAEESYVREFSVPAKVTVAKEANLTDAVFDNAASHPDNVAFRRKVDDEWQPITSSDFAEDVRRLAKGLVARGVQP